MERDSYLDGIRSAWLGERFGEVFFTAMAQHAADEPMQSKWRQLAELERVTGARMAALLEAHGERAETEERIEVSDEVLSRYTDVPHIEAMHHMRDVVEKAIVHFDQLLAVAPDEDVPAVRFLVEHEQALMTFVDCEIAGDAEDSLKDVERLLTQLD